MTTTTAEAPLLGRGLTWQEMPVGTRFRTSTRTVTETDLVTFITWAGIVNPLFTDATFAVEVEGYAGRLVPGMITYCFSEGLIAQTGVMRGTGIAMLGTGALRHPAPVFVGDTLHSVVTVTESRASSKPGRGVLASEVSVRKQDGTEVLTYTPVRIIRGSDVDPV
ncbi:MaoC/PaaZ C-terminal domain-containing protein [Streptosporangium sp. NPDC006013]|uniref:MaoC/PaaZ C-terminal domain-containing protein n=1 Tax=Streptosporangium sp. NPDC006013 TaxID=3155596 RepID=UPI0033B9EA95